MAIASLFKAFFAIIGQVVEVFCPEFAKLNCANVSLHCAYLVGTAEELVHKFAHLR